MRLLSLALLLAACRDKSTGDTDDGVTDTVEEDADGDGYLSGEDCSDTDSSVYPGAVELCDGIDNNCDGEVDEGVLSTFYGDTDADGFGDPGETVEACAEPSGTVSVPNDCDDDDADSFPGASERCDGKDNDCDGEVDEDVLTEWYADADSDGYGEPDSAYEVCDPPPGYVDNSDDCDDTNDSAYPGGEEVCDEADNDCDGDTDEGVTTTYYQDVDGDNYGVSDVTTESCSTPTGYADESGDCDDDDRAVSPASAELCDGVDNDCDGSIDEDDAADATTWYADRDSDGYGDSGDSAEACAAPSGYVSDDTDCDDSNADASPGDVEVCDSVDNDCDGEVDEDSATDATTWYADNDGDGYGGDSSTASCTQPSGFSSVSGDCDDGDTSVNPGGEEVCDEADNDCDGDVDEDVTTTFYADADSDGQGDPGSTTEACSPPSGYVSTALDCDDTDGAISPNAEELCDEVDNDCDGDTDEDDAADAGEWYADADGDGYGAGSATVSCSQPSGAADVDGDCDDTDADYSPGAAEGCDGEDYNCDGDVDNDVDGDGYTDADCGGEDCDDDDAAVIPEVGGGCALGTDCLDVLDAGYSDGDGEYTIDPDGYGTGDDPFDVYCDMTTDGGGWTLIVDDDYTTDSCPGSWVKDTVQQVCHRDTARGSAVSASFDAYGITYEEVTGELVAYQYASSNAYWYASGRTVEDIYVDGISITVGASGSREHVFTYAVGMTMSTGYAYDCPAIGGNSPPSFVGSDYLCGSGNSTSTWAYAWYSSAIFSGDTFQAAVASGSTADDVEVRLMCDEEASSLTYSEDVGLRSLALYVR
jgi:hypothetical protein